MLYDAQLVETSPEQVLLKVSEEDIVHYYLRIPVIIGSMFRSPLRLDENPTCVFSYYKGRLRYRDWSEPRSKDVWDLVREKLGLASFHEAVVRVSTDFKVAERADDPQILEQRIERMRREVEFGSKSLIQVKIRPFDKQDGEYLKQFGITKSICKTFGVFAIEYAWIGGNLVYSHRPHDPCLGYYFGQAEDGSERWKLYYYKRKKGDKKSKTRFVGNTNRINGWEQLPQNGNVVVLTKSLKDVMTLHRLGIPACAMQNEVTEPYDYIVEELKSRFKKVFTLYDFDSAGIRMACSLRRKYGLEPLFLTNGWMNTRDWGSKDISDYVRDHGLESTQKLIEYVARLKRINI